MSQITDADKIDKAIDHVCRLAAAARAKRAATTAWLDVTKSDEGLCVAWNSARYLLTTEQARRMVETLSSLLADLKLDPMTGHPVEFMEREGFGRQLVDAMSREPAKD